MRKQLTIVLLAVALTLGMASVTAQTNSQDSEVNVTVSSFTQLDVRPTELSYSGLNPGDEASSTDEAQNHSTITVENIGSNTIDTVYAETSQPTTNPFGTGDSANYDSGNFITVSTATAQGGDYSGEPWLPSIASGASTNFHYVNRLEFVDTPVPNYIDTTTNSDAVNFNVAGSLASDVGRFREGDEWYFYTIYHDDDTQYCDSDAELWVGTEPHTPTTLGTTDFTNATSNGNVDRYSISSASDNVGSADSAVQLASGPDLTYQDVYTYCDTSNKSDGYTLRSRFNLDPDISASGANISQGTSTTVPIFDDTSGDNSEALQPGAYFPVDVTVQVPQGVVDESINGGRLSLLAESS